MTGPAVLTGGREVRHGSAGQRGSMTPCPARPCVRPASASHRRAPAPGDPPALARRLPIPVWRRLVLARELPIPALGLPVLARELPIRALGPPVPARRPPILVWHRLVLAR